MAQKVSTRSRRVRTVARAGTGALLPLQESSRDGERETYLWPQTHLRAVPHLGRVHYRRALPELPPHWHENAYEICLLRAGYLHWEIGGQKVLLGSGEVLVLAPSAEHGGARSMMERCRLDFLQINAQPRGARLAPLVSALATWTTRPRPAGAEVGAAFDRVMAEARGSDRWKRAGMEAAVNSLLVAVLRAYETAGRGGVGFSEPVARAVRHLEQNEGDWPTVHMLARVAGVGATRLQETFRRETGLNINAYALDRRVVKAKLMLKRGHRSAATAAALGFSSSQYFATVFKRHVGETPAVFANREQEAI